MPEAASDSSRLDAELVRRGLSRSRAQASEAIAAGRVSVDGRAAVKPATRVTASTELAIDQKGGYVSRSAHKLIGALDAFPVEVAGRLALDVGASTGGFTQVLLERGAREVIALDVGHAQLVAELRDDPRVRVVEGVNARFLDAAGLARVSGVAERPGLVVADLSFISLTTVLPALVASAGPLADFVLLIKPQFEVGRGGVREGIVRSAALRREAVTIVLWAAHDAGLKIAGLISSTLLGANGNQEYLVWLSAVVGGDPTEWMSTVSALA